MIIERINSPKDLKVLNRDELVILASEIREALLNSVSKYGGHLGPNLGVVEMSIALHYVFNSPIDKFVFDVSHQCYTHKILTGRKAKFLEEGKYGLYSGFTNPEESEHDFFEIGHTSTAVSLANGLAKGRDLLSNNENIIAIIGDGSLSGGEAFEGFNNVAELDTNTIIILNDNEMSIAENHGGYINNLNELRRTKGEASNNMFKAIGLDYLYLEEGNDLNKLIDLFNKVKDIDHPIVLHIHTLKGCGYKFAVENPEKFHCPPPFDLETGEFLYKNTNETYPELTIRYIESLANDGEPIVAINAATPGFIMAANKERRERLGKHFVDVGICEEHAAAMASGVAKAGAKVIWGVSASFIQRTYDQISQDICLNNSPVTILVYNGGGLSGQGSPTHSGIYDIAMVSSIPNLVHLAPSTKEEYLAMLKYSIYENEHPVLIRVPLKVIPTGIEDTTDYSIINKSKVYKYGRDVAIIAVGSCYERALELDKALGGNCSLINPIFLSGLDTELLESLKKDHRVVVALEDGVLDGGFASKIASFYGPSSMKVLPLGILKEFHRNKSGSQMLDESKMSIEQMVSSVNELLK